MYIISHRGFFAIRQSKLFPGKFEIRSRRRTDINGATMAIDGDDGDDGAVIETAHADYPYRIMVEPAQLPGFFEWLQENIGPPSIKESPDTDIAALGSVVFLTSLDLDDRYRHLDSEALEAVTELP